LQRIAGEDDDAGGQAYAAKLNSLLKAQMPMHLSQLLLFSPSYTDIIISSYKKVVSSACYEVKVFAVQRRKASTS